LEIEKVTKCGIGPEFSIIAVLSGVLTGWLTYFFPDWFIITCIPYSVLVIIGVGLLMTGTVIYVHSLRVFNRGYRKEQLVVAGPYSVVRHPIYAAWILLICPGTILFFRSWLMLLIPLTAYISFKILIHKEDDYLKGKFGQAYSGYRSKINELLPSWIFWRKIAVRLRSVIKHENSDCKW
jgi:protein-S-isoprenylcysteine O-methyltransferase Ste14